MESSVVMLVYMWSIVMFCFVVGWFISCFVPRVVQILSIVFWCELWVLRLKSPITARLPGKDCYFTKKVIIENSS